jgi:chromatin structure-remodeling complex subunit RSC1/2
MQSILNYMYDYRTEDGFDPSKLFHKRVNKRVIPEYYETIKEPVALSTIKQKILRKEYHNFKEFVREFALIPHNAQVFNVPDSGAFQDALIIKAQLESQLQKLVENGTITQEVAILPDLGEIPAYENVPAADAAEAEMEDEQSSDEDGDEDDDDDEDEGGRKKRRGPRASMSASKRETLEDGDGKRARGRPPKLLTPMEARMQTILKGIRKPKNSRGQVMIRSFDRLPDKATLPDYYQEIKNPMAYDQLKRKVKRKKYKTLEDFMADVNLIFNNAKQYNTDDSDIYKDAVALQIEAGKLYDAEKAKPDEAFVDDEGKVPLPNGILHNGELYKVGDWVHIHNPNDLTKPIPAQIYRTYKAPDGQSRVNVCWYYRPEQTVHRFDKHFFENEVVKTGRYTDHSINEVEGRCFIMFYTRYFKGRPRGIPAGTDVYVCQARYNETLHQFNTIKTWASCLPDEVRDKDYEMDLFDHPRKMKKYLSPLAYMLKDDQKETDELPKLTWGADGAPPKVGAVHRRPRNEKDSPPPEPTPPPAPKPPTPPPRQLPPPTPQQSYTPATTQQHQQAPRPPSNPTMPIQQYTPRPMQFASAQPATVPRPLPATPVSYAPTTPLQPQTMPPRPVAPTQPSYPPQQQSIPLPPNPAAYAPRPPTQNYRDPPPIEVYTLPDAANLSIPAELRDQFQQDDTGRVLFFTAPPVSVDPPEPLRRGHSVRYLAERARRADLLTNKRKERDAQKHEHERDAKHARLEATRQSAHDLQVAQAHARDLLDRQLASSLVDQLGDLDLRVLGAAQHAEVARKRARDKHERERAAMRSIQLGSDFFADDWDSRIVS